MNKKNTVIVLGICLIMLFTVNQQPQTIVRAAGPYTHSVLSDFEQPCANFDKTVVSMGGSMGDGAIVAAGSTNSLFDTFIGSDVSTDIWDVHDWAIPSGVYTPTVSSGAVTLPDGGRLLSNTIFNIPSSSYLTRTLEVVTTFNNAPFQHIGFSDPSVSKYLLISTKNVTDTLYARIENGSGEIFFPLGSIPSGPHIYRIEWKDSGVNDEIGFFIDGTQIGATQIVSNTNLTNMNVLLGNGGSAGKDLVVNSVTVWPTYRATSHYTSCWIDAGIGNTWDDISWVATIPAVSGVGLMVDYRTSMNGTTFSAWNNDVPSGTTFTGVRYVQYRLNLSSVTTNSPIIQSISLNTPGALPTNTPSTTDTATATATDTATATATDTATATATDTATATVTDTTTATVTDTTTATVTDTTTATVTGTTTATVTGTTQPSMTATTTPITSRKFIYLPLVQR